MTVRFGKMPRPSGMRHTPMRASASALTPVTSRPHSVKLPALGAIWPHATRERGRLARAVRAQQGVHLSGQQREADAVEDVDSSVPGAHRHELQHGSRASRRRSPRSHYASAATPRYALLHLGIDLDVVGPAAGDDSAEVEHVDVRACAHDERHVVLDQQDAETVGRPVRAADRRARRSRLRRDRTTVRRATAPWARAQRACELDEPRGAGRQQLDLHVAPPGRCRPVRAIRRRERPRSYFSVAQRCASRARRARSRARSGCRRARGAGTCARSRCRARRCRLARVTSRRRAARRPSVGAGAR